MSSPKSPRKSHADDPPLRNTETGKFYTSRQLTEMLREKEAECARLETRLRALEAVRRPATPTSTRPTTSTTPTRTTAKPSTGRTAAELLALPHKEAAALDARAASFPSATAERAEIRQAFESLPAGETRSKFYAKFKSSLNTDLQ